MLQANLLVQAQVIDGTTAHCMRIALNGLEEDLREEVQEQFGAILVKMMKERMSASNSASGSGLSGRAKTPEQAIEHAKIFQLLEALDHPTVELLGVASPMDMPQRQKAVLRGQQQAEGHSQGAQAQPSQPEQARKRGRKRATAPQADHVAGFAQQQQPQQQQQQTQQQQTQQQVPAAANYGPESRSQATDQQGSCS